MLPLAGLTAVENKLASGTRLEQQVRVIARANTAVCALSLVARADGLAYTGGGEGYILPTRRNVPEKSDDMSMAFLQCNFLKVRCKAKSLEKMNCLSIDSEVK